MVGGGLCVSGCGNSACSCGDGVCVVGNVTVLVACWFVCVVWAVLLWWWRCVYMVGVVVGCDGS